MGLFVTIDRAWETSHTYLTTIPNINGMVYFINANNTFNAIEQAGRDFDADKLLTKTRSRRHKQEPVEDVYCILRLNHHLHPQRNIDLCEFHVLRSTGHTEYRSYRVQVIQSTRHTEYRSYRVQVIQSATHSHWLTFTYGRRNQICGILSEIESSTITLKTKKKIIDTE